MKKLTKILALSMILILVASAFAACGKKNETDEGKLKVVATIFPQYDFLRVVGGDKVDVTMMLPPGSESHSFEPTPKDIEKINQSALFVYTGGDSDAWVEDILESLDNKDLHTFKLMDSVDVLEEETVEGMEEEHDHDHDGDHDHDEDADHDHDEDADHDHEAELDEHVWTSPENAIKIVRDLADELGEIDPENSQYYHDNAESYVKELKKLDKEFKEVVKNGKRKEIIFADRFPLRYFVEEYDLEYYAAFPGCSTDTEASASTVAFLIDKVKEDQIPVVFHIELSNQVMADSISEATGAEKVQFNAVHNVAKEDFENGVSYLSLMKQNVKALEKALN